MSSTTSITLSTSWQQLSDGTGTVTAQLRSAGFCDLYIGDTAPDADSPSLRVPADGVTLASGAVAYVKGSGTLVAATV